MKPEIDLLAIEQGSVSAPAGCGKTHLIAAALTRGGGPKPILVLTHTNAGVIALRSRLDRAGVSPNTYRLSTIDGWAMRLISTFPMRSGHNPQILKLARAAQDYPAIRLAAAKLLNAGHLKDVLAASYDRLIVDEYQDCTIVQHYIVAIAAQTLKTCVLGDPLQAIFGFAGKLVDWTADVCKHFPAAGELATPHRWINAGERAFGEWLLDARSHLLARTPVDLRSAPANVTWIPLDGTADQERRLQACRTPAPTPDGGVLIIGDSRYPKEQRRFASQTPGAVTVESVDLRDLVDFAQGFNLRHPNALDSIVSFADNIMTGLGRSAFLARVATHRSGMSPTPPTEAERAALAFCHSPSHLAAVDVLVELNKQAGVTVHRPTVLACCIKTLRSCRDDIPGALADAAVKVREENRLLGRPLPKRAVGSTLLLKGLEAEVAVIVDLSGMDRAHLYVAMTRGSKKLVVCSPTSILFG
jgi:DNA helicase-2/ATP-dependent DNA helicase PcrA